MRDCVTEKPVTQLWSDVACVASVDGKGVGAQPRSQVLSSCCPLGRARRDGSLRSRPRERWDEGPCERSWWGQRKTRGIPPDVPLSLPVFPILSQLGRLDLIWSCWVAWYHIVKIVTHVFYRVPAGGTQTCDILKIKIINALFACGITLDTLGEG